MENIEKINTIKWKDKELVLHDFKKSHANGGRLEKFWVEDIKTGRQYLIKGSTALNYEPFSEKIAYIVGKNLGMDVLEYDILPAKLFKGMIKLNPFCRYVSICEKIDRKGYSITSVAEIKRARNIVKDPGAPNITNREVMYEILDPQYIDTMILFDAIIGNVDRHYGNVHLLRGRDGEMIGAPILDNGASLLAQTSLLVALLLRFKVGKYIDTGTIDKTHSRQVKWITSINGIPFNITSKTIQILNEIEPVLELMPRLRAKCIRRYLIYRLHKFLGIIKKDNKKIITLEDRLANKDIIKEKEHT